MSDIRGLRRSKTHFAARFGLAAAICAALGFAVPACTKKPEPDGNAASSPDPQAALVSRGRSVYMGACVACHGAEPARDGSIGPKIVNPSMELLEARVLKAEYPPGFEAQRKSKLMPAMPHLKSEIAALHAYLNRVR